jgi:hypothetical protein
MKVKKTYLDKKFASYAKQAAKKSPNKGARIKSKGNK